ncbi:MAG: DUF393 domain-containing protein [Acidobacteria bacterium]|nr:DUF393 domain-containing protein [Acidobacteriota bacterium]MBI3662832.1 DUF393 domain-containing protein [Acidobacteriota bacterium]
MNALFSDGPTKNNTRRGWVFYDAECAFCTSLILRIGPALLRRGFHCAALQDGWVALALGIPREELLSDLRLRTARGEILNGADAIVYLSQFIWWAWPMYAFAQIPSPRELLRVAYRWIAARRHCSAAAALDGARHAKPAR